MIALALAKSGKVPELASMVDAAGNPINAVAQGAYPMLVRDLLPVGLRGAVVAGLLAALMTSLAAAYNACSTLFTMDFWTKFRPKAPQHELVWVGRIATTVMVLIGLAWIPVIQGARGLYDYLQGVQGYLAPPIFVVFFFGVFNKRLNAKGCLWALMVGLRPRRVPSGRGYARHAEDGRFRERVPRGLVSLDREPHLLPVLQPAHHYRVDRDDVRGELRDASRRPRRSSSA